MKGVGILKRIIAIIICLTIPLCVLSVSAESNYEEYNYSTTGEAVPAPKTYEPTMVYYGDEATDLTFSSPQDIATDSQGNLYLLDSGNNRLVVYDENFNLKNIITPPVTDGQEISFTGCVGLFVTDGLIYISDKENGLIYVIGVDGGGKKVIRFTPQAVVDDSFIFKPVHITVDESGIIQVQAEGCYNGLITLDNDGNMVGYYSANSIQTTLSVLTSQFWKNIFSEEQQDNMKQTIPIEYSSIAMDADGFVYTTTKTTENSTFEIKKLNPYGDNILGYDDTFSSIRIANGDYGDLRTLYTDGRNVDTTFEDIYVDGEGFIFALDTTRGRVFQYDQNSNLISVFGGIGDQTGTFALPSAVCGYNSRIYVLDEFKNSLTVFEPTNYVNNIRKALILDADCEYEAAVEYWNEVYRENCNSSLALSGIGKAAYEKGEIKKAMKYFKLADDRTNYDIAFDVYRTQFIRENFIAIASLIVLLAIGLVVFFKIRKRKVKKDE